MQDIVKRLKNLKRDEEASEIIMESIAVSDIQIKKHRLMKNQLSEEEYAEKLRQLEKNKRALVLNYELISAEISSLKAAISKLDEIENKVMRCFYMEQKYLGADILGQEIGYSRSWVYKKKRKVIDKLAKLLYGGR